MLRNTGCVTAAVVLLPILGADVVAAAIPGECVVVPSTGRCLITATDPGRPGGPTSRSRPSETPPSASRQDAPRGNAATPRRDPLPPVGPAVRATQLGAAFGVDPGEPPAAPRTQLAPSPEELARVAIAELTMRGPVIRFSATEGAFVGVPVWLWVDRGEVYTGPTSATATVGDAAVTATGELVAVEWTMGPPGERVVCGGPGTPWAGQPGPSPDCGYTYALRSLPERTDGTGRWRIVATSVWRVEWSGVSGGAPVAGGQTVRVSAASSLPVGEIHVLVSGGGS